MFEACSVEIHLMFDIYFQIPQKKITGKTNLDRYLNISEVYRGSLCFYICLKFFIIKISNLLQVHTHEKYKASFLYSTYDNIPIIM